MFALVAFFVMNGLVFSGAVLVARYGIKIRDHLAIGLAAALLGWVFVVTGLEVLGLFGQIRLGPAVCLAASGFLIGGWFWWRERCRVSAKDGASCSTGFERTSATEVRCEGAGRTMLRGSMWLAVAIAGWAALEMLISGLCIPVLPVSDAPIYHLYFAVRWWQSGTLEIVPTPFGESAAPYFPANGDVWFTWLLLPWGSEVVVKVGQWPFLLLGMVAVYALAREIDARREIAVFPAVMWGTSTLSILHSGIADVDLIMAAWYLVSTWFLVRYARRHDLCDLCLSAVAMGAVLGTKYIAMLFVPWLFLAAAMLAWRAPHRWRHLAVLVICVTLPGIYGYARNAILTGNPLYPLHWELLGVPVFRGWYNRETLLASEYHIPVTDGRSFLRILLRAMDPVMLPAWLGGMAGSVWASAKRRQLPLLLTALAYLHIVLFWFVNPYQTQDRFLFGAFALLAIPLAIVLNRWPILCLPLTAMIGWHLVIGLSVFPESILEISGFGSSDPSLPSLLPAPLPLFSLGHGGITVTSVVVGRLALFGSIAGATACWAAWRGGRARRAALAGLMCSLVVLGVAVRTRESWIPNRVLRFYPYWLEGGYTDGWLRLEGASRRGARVAYAGTNLPFYLFGIGLRNEVRYVNVNSHAGFRMHDYHALFAGREEPLATSATPDWDRREADESAWLANLGDRDIELLFVGYTNRAGGLHNFFDRDGFPIERTWADRHPEIFYLLHSDERTRLYAVRFR